MATTEFAASFVRLAANHLWQSTGVAAVAVLLALALKGNGARVKHWLWLAASVKFLIPFAALASIGGAVGWWLVPATPVAHVPVVMAQMVQPFAAVEEVAMPIASPTPKPAVPWLPILLLASWFCGFVAVLLHGWVRWRRVAAAVRSSAAITDDREMEALRRIGGSGRSRFVSSNAKLEPGVFGIFRQVILLPAGIADRLNDAELESILAHELCHIRRRDNLTAMLHMAVEAIFWFHPMVWWLGARLTEERERACDEDVLRMGGDPQVYAESILKVCEFYLASPVACAAGVTGGELRSRIEAIVRTPFTRNLSFAKKALLALTVVAALAVPVAVGILHAQAGGPAERPRFEVVSVKQDHTGILGGAGDWPPGTHGPSTGRWRWTRINLLRIIADAYDVKWDQVVAIPKTFQAPEIAFNIEAKFPPETTTAQFRLMLQSLLADRFHFSMHRETRELPAIALEVARGGLKLKPASGDCVQHTTKAPPDEYRCGALVVSLRSGADFAWEYVGRSVSMADIAAGFQQNEPVVDTTGVPGLFDIDVQVAFQPHPASDDPNEQMNDQVEFHTDFKSSFEKQAGLTVDLGKLKKLPVAVIVVDHVVLPTPN